MMDCFDENFHLKNYPKSLKINYIKEQKLNNQIQIYKIQKSEFGYIFSGKNNEIEAVRGEIEFDKF